MTRDYSAFSTTDIDWPVERIAAGERKKEVELGSVRLCKHLLRTVSIQVTLTPLLTDKRIQVAQI